MPPVPDTIAAVATPPGRGGIGIVRISGPRVRTIALALLGGSPEPRLAEWHRFRDGDGDLLDEGLAVFFPAPRSFTGEDVLELHGHGGPVVLDMLLARVLALGARLARPGEFTERAFLNDKLDLAQAEAVADLIDAGTRAAARAAVHSLTGAFSAAVQRLAEAVMSLRVYVEAAIDFPDEEVDFLSDGAVHARLCALRDRLEEVAASAHQGQLLRDGMTVVIAGRPNAGKSSLLNRLSGEDTAIVTEIPGTTRDVLRARIQITGMPVHIVDTAGLRESADPVEREGVRRAWREIETADRILLVVDDRDGLTAEDATTLARLPAAVPVTVVHNKIDLTGRPPGLNQAAYGRLAALSAKTGAGLPALQAHLAEAVGFHPQDHAPYLARRRHLEALRRAGEHLETAQVQLADFHAGELVAEELRLAQLHLGEITGAVRSDDLLGRIFATFCIGK
jgi:tRNA modification GTPase